MRRRKLELLVLFSIWFPVSLLGQASRANSLKLAITSIEQAEFGYTASVSVANEGSDPITLALQTSPAGLNLQSLDIQQWDDTVGWESVGACRDVAPSATLIIPAHSRLWDVQPIFDLSKLDYVTVVCPRKLRTVKGRVRAILYFAYASQADFDSGHPILKDVTSAPVALNSFVQQHDKIKGNHPSASDKGEPCLFQFERGVLSDCIRKSATGGYVIAPTYLKDLHFDSHGLARVRSESAPYGWMYVNKEGVAVVWGVPTFDNWADEFHDGLVRVLRNGKYGYANRTGKVVIRPAYEGALSFEKGTAVVCRQCRTTSDREHSWFTGGNWFRIDTSGKVIKRLKPQ